MLSLRDTKKKMIEEITPSLILRLNKLTLSAWNINLSLCKENEEKKKRKKTYNQKNIGTIQKQKKKKNITGPSIGQRCQCPTSPPPS